MKTWEMIKELTKNPKKKFIRKGDSLEITVDGLMYLRWESGHEYINLDHDWEEVKEPVNFMTAASNGKFIRVEHDLIPKHVKSTFKNTREMLSYLVKTFISSGVVEILTEGKFYIEEEN